jgi:uncharacterized protein (TIGR02687 family)
MSTAKIQSALEKEFGRRRVICWYDETAEWWPEFDGVSLPGVEKVTVEKNEFGVKHRIAREEPDRKFLLYFRGQRRPDNTDNWLLDQLLISGDPFLPDRASLALMDAELPPEYKALAAAHLDFFGNAERVSKLKEWLCPGDTETAVRLKMICVLCRAEPTVDAILLSLLGELSAERTERLDQIEKYGLADAWWKQLAGTFGYLTTAPTLLDFVLCIFRAVTPLGAAVVLDPRQALVFLNRWKDSEEFRESFEKLSGRAEGVLNVSAALNQIVDIRPLLTHETYRRIDLRVIADLRDGLVNGTLAPTEARQRAEARGQLHWARHDKGLRSLYRAIADGAELVEVLPKLDLTIESFDAGIEKYAGTWWRMDQIYRQFVYHYTDSGQAGLLEKLAERIEGLYVNEFLSRLGQRWQEWVDRRETWQSASVANQREFIARFVTPHLTDGRKVLVIVSDALRYEVGRSLLERILCEDRWTAEIQPFLAVLPSVTQLGMAALLPHETLEFAPDGKTVVADGANTVGTAARGKILASAFEGKAAAISAEDFLGLNSKTEGRELTRGNDVLFVYHNAIDMVGDKRDTEHKTCQAVEHAIEDVIRLLKKGAAMNASHFIVTADHGFLYQHEPVAESDFLEVPDPNSTVQRQRRYVLAQGVSEDSRMCSFGAEALGLGGGFCFSFPKGIQRLRLQGAGSRYVHGGTSLQEVVLPLLEVKKLRASDVAKVDVDILRTGQQITTGQVSITFVQGQPVGEKCLGRELRAGFYSKTGVPISEVKTLTFGSSADDARRRERKEQFVFSREADAFNQQEIELRLEELVTGTTQYAPYREFRFTMRRAFESDFDEI